MSEEGEITVGTPLTHPDPPPGLVALSFYEITTTKSYTGSIIIRLVYGDNAVPPEQEIFIRMWLWNESSPGIWSWVDITTSVDTDSNIVYGLAPHLSMFGVTSIQPAPPGVTIVEATCSKTIVGLGCNLTISFILQNQGDFTETFDISIYRNSTILATYPLNMPPKSQTLISFRWNTTGCAKSNYTISAGTYLIHWVVVTILGDLNGDYIVDGQDYQLVKRAIPSSPSNPSKWNPNADLNDDGIIDGQDLQMVKSRIGQH
jgi:hypothetical protein